MNHWHSCPSCYEKYLCDMDCTIEPDLSDDGRPFGSYCICDDCRRETPPSDLEGLMDWYKVEGQYKRPSKAWWKIYHGLKR